MFGLSQTFPSRMLRRSVIQRASQQGLRYEKSYVERRTIGTVQRTVGGTKGRDESQHGWHRAIRTVNPQR